MTWSHRRAAALALVAGGLLATGIGAAETPKKRPTDQARGRELYDRHCYQCHGFTNRGDGPATGALVHEVPDLVGRVTVDDATILLVQRGRKAMPGFEASFDKADSRRVLMHMARLGNGGPADAPPAEPATDEDVAEFDGGDAAP